jgi:ABC-type transport system involved in cytochrome c biogenesis ATPase subunit
MQCHDEEEKTKLGVKEDASLTALKVRNLCFGFAARPLFTDWNADFPAGLSLILGGEGVGKTSLLRLLAGECAPQSGAVTYQGPGAGLQDLSGCERVFWRDPRTPWPDVTPQGWMDGQRAQYPAWCDSAWRRHVSGFGLEPHLHKSMHQLSTGSQRKVLLAAALASGAPLTLLDEPEAALDRPSIAYLRAALVEAASDPRWPARAVVVAHYDTLGSLPWRHIVELKE